MRVSSNFNTDYLSEWKKIEIKDDTLFFETFGEWKQLEKAKIEYQQKGMIKLTFLNHKFSYDLTPIDKKVNFNSHEKFWDGFQERQRESNCIKK